MKYKVLNHSPMVLPYVRVRCLSVFIHNSQTDSYMKSVKFNSLSLSIKGGGDKVPFIG
jgi:hypothetical protein